MTRDRLLFLLKLVVSVGLIVVLVQRVDVDEVWGLLRGARLPLLLAGMVLYMGAIGSNALKWGVLLRAQGVRVPLASLLRHTFVGVFFANFLPFVGADVVRGYGLAREIEHNADATVSVVVDRLVGLLVFMVVGTLSAVAALALPGLGAEGHDILEWIALIGGVATTAALVVFALMLSGRVRRWVERLVARLPRLAPLAPLVIKLSEAVGAYRRQPGALVRAALVGATTIVLSNVVNWLLFSAVGEPINPLYVFIFNPIIGMTMALPISLAGLGVNQNLFPWLYGLVGVPAPAAVAASLLLQLTILLTSLPGGFFWAVGRRAGGGMRVEPHPPVTKPEGR